MPTVSVVIPCLNEEATIYASLEGFLKQTFPTEQMEVVIADGDSTDRTIDEIARFQDDHPELPVRIVRNPKRIIPCAMNLLLQEARGTYVVRMDAHAVPAPNYVELCIRELRDNRGENVGALLNIEPQNRTYLARAIAVATGHPLGVGGAQYRCATAAGCVDTVAFGAYSKATADRVGPYNESLPVNEDYEWNARLRAAGGRVWLNPEIRCTYFPRGDLASLAKQYYNYGYWKVRMLRLFPASMKLRQTAPPVFVAGMLTALLVTAVSTIWLRQGNAVNSGSSTGPGVVLLAGCLLFPAVALAHLATIAAGVLPALWKRRESSLLPGVVLAIATMHWSWGLGFWRSLFQSENSQRPAKTTESERDEQSATGTEAPR